MNTLKASSPCSLLGLSVLMSFFWISSGAAGTVLKTQRIVLTPQNATSVVQFTVPGPGNLTLEVTAAVPLNKIGLIARGADPTGTDIRKDGTTPMRLDFPVAAKNLTKGNVWTVFTTIMGTNGMIYAIPGTAAIVDLKVSFVSNAPAQKTAREPRSVLHWGGAAQSVSGMATGKSGPAQLTSGMATGKSGTPQVTSGMATGRDGVAPPASGAGTATGRDGVAPPASGAGTATGRDVPPAEPRWPLPFELGAGERNGFGFVVGKPGPITVNVKWTGVPLTVSLAKPGGSTVVRQGNGSVTLQYHATAEDVKKGVLWSVSIHPAQEAPKPAGSAGIAVIDKPIKEGIKVLSKGSISVQHPTGDMKLAQAELKARADKAQALQSKQQPAAAQVNILAQKQAALQKQKAVRQAALLEQVKPKLPVQSYQQMSQRIAVGANPAAVSSQSSAMTGAPGGPASAMGTGGRVAVQKVMERSQITRSTQTVAPDPVPAILSLSVPSGHPGDPVLITGSGFSNDPGEVRFVVSTGRPGKEVTAPVSFWSDTQILAMVPDVSGYKACDGQVYVIKGGKFGSAPKAFRFEPAMEYRVLSLRDKLQGAGPGYGAQYTVWIENGAGRDGQNGLVSHYYGLDPFYTPIMLYGLTGGRGDDDFSPFRIAAGSLGQPLILKNGWTTDSAYLSNETNSGGIVIGSSANAYITEFSPYADTPNLKVHWWADAFSYVGYTPYVIIKGPKGVPYY